MFTAREARFMDEFLGIKTILIIESFMIMRAGTLDGTVLIVRID